MDGAMAADMGRLEPIRRMPVGVAGSVALHAALLAALFLLTPLRNFVTPEPAAISVELVPLGTVEPAPEPLQAAPAPETAPVTETAPARPTPGSPTQDADGVFHATTLYAQKLLQQPEMAAVRRNLTRLADSERVTQLCNVEALEQIRRAAPQYSPDTMVSYAMADPVSAGLLLTAMGGAFRSRRQWYSVSFQCVAAPTLDGVTSFSFQLGQPIPRAEWEDHNLNAEDEDE